MVVVVIWSVNNSITLHLRDQLVQNKNTAKHIANKHGLKSI